MSSPPPPGVYVPVPTFFASKSASNYDPVAPPIDAETQAAHAIHLAKSGIRGVVIFGSTGEAIHVSNSERAELFRHVKQEVEKAGFKDFPIIAGTATQNIGDTVQQLKEAKDAGCGWGLVLTPGYFAGAVSQQGLVDWFSAIADRSPIPIMIYHYPGVTNNVVLTPKSFETLAAHRNIVGCKLSHGDMTDHTLIAANPAIDHTHFATWSGLGQQLLPAMAIGCVGVIDGLSSFFPKSVVHLYNTFQKTPNDFKTLREVQYKIAAGEKIVVRWGTVGIKEATSRVLGFGDRDGARLPLRGGLGDEEWENWRPAMEELEKLEKSLPEVKPGSS